MYYTAALGVVLDQQTNTQQFFGGYETADERRQNVNHENGHNDDITCIAMSMDRLVAVTGQRGPVPSIFSWNANTGEKITKNSLPKGARGVAAISISSDSKFIVAVDMSDSHNVHMI